MSDYKKIPFDITKAKSDDNPKGLDVVTEDGRDVRIICVDKLDVDEYTIVALVKCTTDNGVAEEVVKYNELGECVYNVQYLTLYLKMPSERRRMTYRELSWWLRECPQEHREVTVEYKDTINSFMDYTDYTADLEVAESYKVRVNGGEWQEPLIEM